MIYLKFETPITSEVEDKPNNLNKFWVKSAIKILKKIIPEANPDYQEQIDNVKTWLIEIDSENEYPNREIGIDVNGNVIMSMPDDRNYGYWTDNKLYKKDFEEHFDTVEIKVEMFDKLWNEFEKRKNTDAND